VASGRASGQNIRCVMTMLYSLQIYILLTYLLQTAPVHQRCPSLLAWPRLSLRIGGVRDVKTGLFVVAVADNAASSPWQQRDVMTSWMWCRQARLSAGAWARAISSVGLTETTTFSSNRFVWTSVAGETSIIMRRITNAYSYKKLSWCWLLTNPRDAFKGQSRSPNIVPFHMLDIVSC